VRFWTGTHMPGWLEMTDAPLFISRVRLDRCKTLPRRRAVMGARLGRLHAAQPAAAQVDDARRRVRRARRRYASEIGGMEWAAPQDWMCEPWIVEKTGLSVREHQERTVANYLDLRGRGPFIPVLQGWTLADYETCADLYEQAGVNLARSRSWGSGRSADGRTRRRSRTSSTRCARVACVCTGSG
jgi:hypothetical protein